MAVKQNDTSTRYSFNVSHERYILRQLSEGIGCIYKYRLKNLVLQFHAKKSS